jgi:hypothetical protein
MLCYCNKSIVMQYDCYVTMEMQQTHCHTTGTVTLLWKYNMVHRSCYQGKPNMSHCPLLKAARPEQPHRCGAGLPARATVIFALGWRWTWRTALSLRATSGDFPFSSRAVRPHAITFSDSCRIDRTVLTGKLSCP